MEDGGGHLVAALTGPRTLATRRAVAVQLPCRRIYDASSDSNGGDTQSRKLRKFLASNFRASSCKFG